VSGFALLRSLVFSPPLMAGQQPKRPVALKSPLDSSSVQA
jgi:hypothetical protein